MPNNLANELIDKDKWRYLLQRFIDVLRINIFIADTEGRAFLTPRMEGYGRKFLASSSIGAEMFSEHSNSLLDKFKKQGFYLEYHYPFELHSFAVPMDLEEGKPIAYMIIGPVILNKRLENSEYESIFKKLNLNIQDFLDIINEIRVVSFVDIKSILDLMYEVSRYIIQLNLQRQKLGRLRFKKEVLSKEIGDVIQNIYSSVYLDELLVTLLDVALAMTKAECGSVMVIDGEKRDLVIKVSKGVAEEVAQNTRLKIGEGIAGIAAKENTSFFISGSECDNRIKHLLKRPEIQQSLVVPITSQSDVIGVLNLHTKDEKSAAIGQNLETIRQLSKLTSAAIHSIQHRNFS